MAIGKIVVESAAQAAKTVAEILVASIQREPEIVLGLATGETMRPVYRMLLKLAFERDCPMNRFTSFNLDEFVGVPPNHPGSFAYYTKSELSANLADAGSRINLPNGMAANPEVEAARYEAKLAASGGIAIQLLGIGRNGHIGFNEPGTNFESRTRVVELATETRQSQHLFRGDAPMRAITMGIGNILEARKCILLATGLVKAEPVAAMLNHGVSRYCPASALALHCDATAILDHEAASLL